jgi:hypothetical protein
MVRDAPLVKQIKVARVQGARRHFIDKKGCSLWEWLPAVAAGAAMAESAPATIKSRSAATDSHKKEINFLRSYYDVAI